MPIGAQMFTLRDHCQTIDDVKKSLERVKAMGYDGIQGSAAKFNTHNLDEVKQIKQALDANGLVCGVTHEGLKDVDDDTIKIIIEKHQILDCKLTAVGGFFPKGEEWSLANWQDFIKQYNETAAKFAEAGLRIGYHNHSHEFAKVTDDKTAIELLVEGLADSVWFEFDMYWVAHGLGDPAEWTSKVAGRIPAVHYKDGVVLPDRTHQMMPVGEGNLNWPKINAACAEAGVEWYLVERDRGPHDPFDALEISIKHMRSWGL